MTEHTQLEIIAAVVLLGGQVIAAWKSAQAAEIAQRAVHLGDSNAQKLDAVHGLVNSEMIKAREMMDRSIKMATEIAFSRGFEQGGREARETSAGALVAAAAALPPVIVSHSPLEVEVTKMPAVGGEPDPNFSGIRRS